MADLLVKSRIPHPQFAKKVLPLIGELTIGAVDAHRPADRTDFAAIEGVSP